MHQDGFDMEIEREDFKEFSAQVKKHGRVYQLMFWTELFNRWIN